MKVLIDTNILLDVITARQPHFENSRSVLRLCGTQLTGAIAASQTTDIFYILRRLGAKIPVIKSAIRNLSDNLKILDITQADVNNALSSGMDDYEDALLAFCGKRCKADYIVTRNVKDFINSPVAAVTPAELLSRIHC